MYRKKTDNNQKFTRLAIIYTLIFLCVIYFWPKSSKLSELETKKKSEEVFEAKFEESRERIDEIPLAYGEIDQNHENAGDSVILPALLNGLNDRMDGSFDKLHEILQNEPQNYEDPSDADKEDFLFESKEPESSESEEMFDQSLELEGKELKNAFKNEEFSFDDKNQQDNFNAEQQIEIKPFENEEKDEIVPSIEQQYKIYLESQKNLSNGGQQGENLPEAEQQQTENLPVDEKLTDYEEITPESIESLEKMPTSTELEQLIEKSVEAEKMNGNLLENISEDFDQNNSLESDPKFIKMMENKNSLKKSLKDGKKISQKIEQQGDLNPEIEQQGELDFDFDSQFPSPLINDKSQEDFIAIPNLSDETFMESEEIPEDAFTADSSGTLFIEK